ncbi:MAG: ABC transporter permease [Planctomycetota bacterium]|nr:ABC transporter permease [Planctomycetota bacterium]
MHAVLAIAMKDLKLLARDRSSVFFTFVFPLVTALLFGFIFSGAGGGGNDAIEVAVSESGLSDAGRAFVADLNADPSIKVLPVATDAEGESLVRKGVAAAFIRVPADFQPGTMMIGGGLAITGVVDPKRTAEAGLLEGKLNQIGFMQLQRAFANQGQTEDMLRQARAALAFSGWDAERKRIFSEFLGSVGAMSAEAREDARAPRSGAGEGGPEERPAAQAGWSPVRVELSKLQVDRRGPPNAFAISFPQGIVWGLMGCVTAFAVGLAEERSRGTLMRLVVAPLSPGRTLLGKALACFIACFVVQFLLLGLATIGFGVSIARPDLLALVMLATATGFTGVMMALAGLARTEAAASGMGRAVVIVMAMIGGGTIPVFFMPKAMQSLSAISPFRWASQAIDGALWRGLPLNELLLPLGVLFGVGIVGYAIGAASFKRARVA